MSLATTHERRRIPVIVRSVSELIHTCYRVLDLDRSIAFYEKLGMEEIGRMSIRDEAINVYMGLPDDGPRLELTYNLGRGMGALAPYTIGAVASLPNVGIGSALALTSAFFLAGAVLIMFFPDTSRKALA